MPGSERAGHRAPRSPHPPGAAGQGNAPGQGLDALLDGGVVGEGKEQVYTCQVVVPVITWQEVRVSTDELRAYDGTGKRIGPTRVPQFLGTEKAVLVTFDGQKVDPVYLQP